MARKGKAWWRKGLGGKVKVETEKPHKENCHSYWQSDSSREDPGTTRNVPEAPPSLMMQCRSVHVGVCTLLLECLVCLSLGDVRTVYSGTFYKHHPERPLLCTNRPLAPSGSRQKLHPIQCIGILKFPCFFLASVWSHRICSVSLRPLFFAHCLEWKTNNNFT